MPTNDVWPVSGNPFDPVADREVIERALARLPMPQRAVVTLHHQFGLTLERVAEVLGVPVGTVWSRLHRAMDGLRAAIEADEREGLGTPDLRLPGSTPARPRARAWVPGPVPPPPSSVDGRRIVVSHDGSGDLPSITDAIRVARDGDLVLVRPGTYRESVVVRRDIAIVGDGDRDAIVLDFHGQDQRASLPERPGLQTPFGVLLDHTRGSLTNLTIRGPRDSVAILVDGGAPTIRYVAGNLDGAWQGGMWLRNFVFVMGDAGGLIADCISDAHVFVWPGSPTIERNDLGASLLVGAPSTRAILRDNAVRIRSRTDWAIGVGSGAAPTIEGNEVSWFEGSAICLGEHTTAIIRGNVVRASRTGIALKASAIATVTDNDVEATVTGILVAGGDSVVAGNVLSGTASGGIVVTGASVPILERNEIDPSVHSPLVIGSPVVRPTLTTVTGATR
jgi:hypothetical protein